MSETALNYRVEGEGPPLLLVHGFMISFNIWQTLLPLLRPHFRLVMPELPGIGASAPPGDEESLLSASVDGLEQIRRELGLERWSVLGYSTGSRIAEAYIQAHPANVCQAIFLCPLIIQANKARALKRALRLDQRVPAFGDWVLTGWRLKFLVSLLGFNLRPDPLSKEWYDEISSRPMKLRKATIRAAAERIDEPFSVQVPYAMIWGDRDLVPATPRKPGPQDHFVHGRHSAPAEAAQEIAPIVVSLLQDGD